MRKFPPKVTFGIGVVIFGFVLVIILFNVIGKASLAESAAISLAMGMYFLGLNAILAGAEEISTKQERNQADEKRDNRLKNIERIVEQWDREKE